MRYLTASLLVLAIGVGAAGCGSGSGTTTSRSTSTSTTTSSMTRAAHGAQAQARNLTGRVRQIVSQAATAAGGLASGNGPRERQARHELAQVQNKARTVARDAKSDLAAGPARTALVQVADQAANAAGKLRRTKIDAAAKRRLHDVQATLHGLAGDLAKVHSQLSGSSLGALAGIAADLGRLEGQLSASG